jgi:hypothetical protein
MQQTLGEVFLWDACKDVLLEFQHFTDIMQEPRNKSVIEIEIDS